MARLLGNILANYGLIEDPEVMTFTKGSIVDGVVGGSSRNVEKMFEAAKGKVLFIDEAYQLADQESKDALDAIKRKRPLIIGVLGCMAERVQQNLLAHHHADLVAGPDAYLSLPDLIAQAETGHKAINIELSTSETYRDVVPQRMAIGQRIGGFVAWP